MMSRHSKPPMAIAVVRSAVGGWGTAGAPAAGDRLLVRAEVALPRACDPFLPASPSPLAVVNMLESAQANPKAAGSNKVVLVADGAVDDRVQI